MSNSTNKEFETQIKILKEELLREIHESENRTKSIKTDLERDLNSKIDSILVINEETKQRISDLQNFNATVQVKVIDNMDDFAKFKINASEDLFSHTLVMEKLENGLSGIVNRFDKMYMENLLIPGKIGDFCQYKNIKDYLEVKLYLLTNLIIIIAKY